SYRSAGRAVRLHVIAHSLGVALAHDFLYGLFARQLSKGTPDFLEQAEELGLPHLKDEFAFWRAPAQADPPELALGSFSASAPQLAILLLRSAVVVKRLHAGDFVDATLLGIRGDRVQWKLFYDIDDILAFRARNLYEPGGAIEEFQVNSGNPVTAHTG